MQNQSKRSRTGSRLSWFGVLIAMTVVAALAACSGESTNVAATHADPGLQRIDGEGFAIMLPGDWFVVDGSDEDLGELFDSAALPDEFTADARLQVRMMFAQQAVRFVAFDLAGGFASNLNLIRLPVPDMPIDELFEFELETLERAGITDFEGGQSDFPAGPGLSGRYSTDIFGGPLEFFLVAIVGQDSYWVFTMTSPGVDPYIGTVRDAAESFVER